MDLLDGFGPSPQKHGKFLQFRTLFGRCCNLVVAKVVIGFVSVGREKWSSLSIFSCIWEQLLKDDIQLLKATWKHTNNVDPGYFYKSVT